MSIFAKIQMGVSALISFFSISSTPPALLPIHSISLPNNFEISIFASDVEGARSMTWGKKWFFVSTRRQGKIYALHDKNKNFSIDTKITLFEGLNSPNGIVFYKNDLYIAEIHRILKVTDVEKHISTKLRSKNYKIPFKVLNDSFPKDAHHGWKYLAIGPDNHLYVPVGAPCNICDKSKDNPIYASIQKMNLDGTKITPIALGVRNSVGFDFHPKTGKLWFTDNGRDWLGDDEPPCELNKVEKEGEHFGFPYCHGGYLLDEKFGKGFSCSSYKKPFVKLKAHVAPLGMIFYKGKNFPSKYKHQIFIAEHGSWNRTKKSGYRVTLVNPNKPGHFEVFAKGWHNKKDDSAWGRPVAITHHPKDGSLLVSDDYAGVVYRIFYQKK